VPVLEVTTLSLAQQCGMMVLLWSAHTEDWKVNGSSYQLLQSEAASGRKGTRSCSG
jgi:hypothetical protein